jgi:sec-independent protein translocase protein TatB
MFGVGTQEVLVILLVALLLFGGKRIPEIARSLGKGVGDFRRAIHEVQREVDLELLKDATAEEARRGSARSSPGNGPAPESSSTAPAGAAPTPPAETKP